jgi:hypothetical protein
VSTRDRSIQKAIQAKKAPKRRKRKRNYGISSARRARMAPEGLTTSMALLRNIQPKKPKIIARPAKPVAMGFMISEPASPWMTTVSLPSTPKKTVFRV